MTSSSRSPYPSKTLTPINARCNVSGSIDSLRVVAYHIAFLTLLFANNPLRSSVGISSFFWTIVVCHFFIHRLTSITHPIIPAKTQTVANHIAISNHSWNQSSLNALVSPAAVPCHHSNATSISAPAMGGRPNNGHNMTIASPIPSTYCHRETTCANENCGQAIHRIFLMFGIFFPKNSPANTIFISTAGSVDRASSTPCGNSPVDHSQSIFPSTSGQSMSAKNQAIIQLGR